MATRSDQDVDDDFSELYKEYTGPIGYKASDKQDKAKTNKRSHTGSDEEEETRDPNAVPADFTSREAKVWEAKSKATERIWKKRKEEEIICKICGESGHFTQGCPSTLGANRSSQDFFERIPARERHVKALFTEKVISKIEKDIGCKINMEEKFILVSGRDRLILKKGVDAVRKLIEEGGDQRGCSSSHISRFRSPEISPVRTRSQRSDSQRSHSGPQNASHFQQRFHRSDKAVQDRVRDNVHKFSKDSPQAYGNDGGRGHASRSKSPGLPPYLSNLYNSVDDHNQSMGAYRTDGWNSERRGSELKSGRQLDRLSFPRTLEELEMEFKREATDLERIRNKEEDGENYKHREAIRELSESYMKRIEMVNCMHAKQWEEFLQLDAQRRQQQLHQQIDTSGYGGNKQQYFSGYDGSMVDQQYADFNLAMSSRNRFPSPLGNCPLRPHDSFSDLRQRREDYGKAYNRY